MSRANFYRALLAASVSLCGLFGPASAHAASDTVEITYLDKHGNQWGNQRAGRFYELPPPELARDPDESSGVDGVATIIGRAKRGYALVSCTRVMKSGLRVRVRKQNGRCKWSYNWPESNIRPYRKFVVKLRH